MESRFAIEFKKVAPPASSSADPLGPAAPQMDAAAGAARNEGRETRLACWPWRAPARVTHHGHFSRSMSAPISACAAISSCELLVDSLMYTAAMMGRRSGGQVITRSLTAPFSPVPVLSPECQFFGRPLRTDRARCASDHPVDQQGT